MALVMLPCDLPWWPQVQRQLTQLALSRSSRELIETMEKIHSMCNISLDPDEEAPDPALFQALERFLEEDLTPEERRHFLEKTSPAMVQRALQLKSLKPPGGLHFSLQQQADKVQLERSFVASLLAHSFFSTFPKRTPKTHPTLQDFNFSDFFRHLDTQCQKAKLRSILQYFDHLENEGLPEQKVIFSRQVMSSKDWLTIEDWLECGLPLVPLLVRHEGRLDRAEPDSLHICFSSSRVGGDVLSDGFTQECLQFCTQPELLTMLSCVEALEDNEVLAIDGVMQVARISGPRHRASMDPLAKPPLLSVCCMDAEIYTTLPISQLEEDNVLRELNKALLGFRQKCNPSTPTLDLSPNAPPTSTASSNTTTSGTSTLGQQQSKRLSPIGESFSSTPPEKAPPSSSGPAAAGARKDLLQPPAPVAAVAVGGGVGVPTLGPGGRRGRFIVLGSSGECLPVSRAACSLYSSCQSESDEEFHSARTSLEHDDSESEEAGARRYSAQLDTPERRSTFAARLRDALSRGAAAADDDDLSDASDDSSSYAVGITVAGAGLQDGDIRVRRGGSRGFMLQEDSTDAHLERERRRAQRRSGARGTRGASSCYSFSTECSSELEELCDQYHRWLGETGAEAGGAERELDARDIAVVRFASSLLKRTLSDSFAGAPLLAEGAAGAAGDLDESARGAHRIAAVARSLSLELARHNHRLAAQLVSLLGTAGRKGSAAPGLRAVASGNWGCGSRGAGDPQLKLIVQWLAASVAGVPALAYYTCGHSRLLKLDTVARVLLDRRWTVGELVTATLRHAQDTLQATAAGSTPPGCLFDELLGMEKPSAAPTTTL
ncbi:hypothetical protein R5R35_009174 [Gryllus longicercus]|uniref:poly(ADP-ribose) glycohydrolase n=1 Tax=Gryllus longicercus TaxID=2509291 RepID=A0AAN9Z786_9ORTH